MIRSLYWTREDPTARITQFPFDTDGKHAKGEEEIERDSEEGKVANYGIVAVAYPWTYEGGRLKPKILDPWREVRT